MKIRLIAVLLLVLGFALAPAATSAAAPGTSPSVAAK
jgi:hypothetical protein